MVSITTYVWTPFERQWLAEEEMVQHKKRRRRGELDAFLADKHGQSERYEEQSSTKQEVYLEGSLSLALPTYPEMHEISSKVTDAVNISWQTPASSSSSGARSSSSGERLTTREPEMRCNATVYHIFSRHGYSPEGECGHEYGVLKEVMTKLGILSNSRTVAISVLRDAWAARAQNRNYDPRIGTKYKARPSLLEDGTVDRIFVCRALQGGLGITQTTCQLNRLRAKRNESPVSWSAVKGFTERSPLIKCRRRRRTKKCGSSDSNSEWSRCRYAQCQELRLRD
jgi:hypothetical protein